jgi:L-lactate dehydrogenase
LTQRAWISAPHRNIATGATTNAAIDIRKAAIQIAGMPRASAREISIDALETATKPDPRAISGLRRPGREAGSAREGAEVPLTEVDFDLSSCALPDSTECSFNGSTLALCILNNCGKEGKGQRIELVFRKYILEETRRRMEINASKVAIVGAGAVGATLAFNLSLKGAVTEIALIDSNREKAEAEILDIKQGASLGRPVNIEATGYDACGDSAIGVVTAGARQRPGESRVDLMDRNVAIMKSIVRSMKEAGFKGILLIITNPVDVLTWVAFAESGFPANRVIGSGTTLDSARLREYVARRCRVNPQNIHGYVLGEHGDTSFPAWSLLTVGGIHFDEFCPVCGACAEHDDFKKKAAEDVRQTAYKIIEAKGSTCYAIGQAASLIVEAIVRDERRILPVSTPRTDLEGIAKTAFSFPTIVGRDGVIQVLKFALAPEEGKLLIASARFVAENITRAGY